MMTSVKIIILNLNIVIVIKHLRLSPNVILRPYLNQDTRDFVESCIVCISINNNPVRDRLFRSGPRAKVPMQHMYLEHEKRRDLEVFRSNGVL